MTAHAVARAQQGGIWRRYDRNTILIGVALTQETELRRFDPQASTMALG
jgi:hypothetical protein